MTATAATLLAWERSQLGTGETPDGSNHTPYAALAGHAPNLPWCATFQVAAARHIGLTLPSESASARAMAQGFMDAGRWGHAPGGWGSAPMVGAFAFYSWLRDGVAEHVEAVEAVNPGGQSFTSIGGNVGNAVRRVVRSLHYVVGFGYPVYDKTVPTLSAHQLHEAYLANHPAVHWPVLQLGSNGQCVAALQRALNVTAGAHLRIDGDFGAATFRVVEDFQRRHGLGVDGVVGQHTAATLT